MQDKPGLKFHHLAVALILFVLVFSTGKTATGKDGMLRVWFLDVGQGDAILVESPTGNQVLIDGGPDNSVVSRLAEIMPFYDHDIDAVVVSHPHSDHIGGLIEVLDRYNVGSVIQASEYYKSSQYTAWQKSVEAEGAENIEAIAGTAVDLGGGARLTILHPFSSTSGATTETPHDYVVVALLEYKKVKVILTGDMEGPIEEGLIAQYGNLIDADVLKVGHHGSKTSTTENFVRAVSPQVAFIGVGAKNRYGHPSPSVIERLESFRIPYYRTDTDGTVELISDGEQFQIITN